MLDLLYIWRKKPGVPFSLALTPSDTKVLYAEELKYFDGLRAQTNSSPKKTTMSRKYVMCKNVQANFIIQQTF